MCAYFDATGCGVADGIDCLCMGVSAVDALQGAVIHRLYAIFYDEKCAAVQFCQIVEQVGRHAVGACAYDYAYDIGRAEGFFVFGLQVGERCVSVCIGLEISQILHVGIFPGEELFAFFQLQSDGF